MHVKVRGPRLATMDSSTIPGDAMNPHDEGLARQFDRRLAQREAELCAWLAAHDRAPPHAGSGEVGDFKDEASREALAAVDAAQAERAALELEQVLVARARLQDHSFGRCEDCGDDIDANRLAALPSARYCASCQAVHERAGGRHPH
jgi:RNA polymerase-binding transcription factor DksA